MSNSTGSGARTSEIRQWIDRLRSGLYDSNLESLVMSGTAVDQQRGLRPTDLGSLMLLTRW